jgi:hypothetical protein
MNFRKLSCGFIVMFLLMACGGDDSEHDYTCSASDRSGLYLIDFVHKSGDCGEIKSVLQWIQGDQSAEGGLCATYAHEWSDDECTLKRVYSCDLGGGLRGEYHSIIHQGSEDGSILFGMMDMTLIQDDIFVCSSIYDIKATRQ